MNRIKKFVSLVVLAAFSMSLASPCWSQEQAPAAPNPPAPSGSSCFEQGSSAGEQFSTGGAFTVGLVSGLVGGLIGTGIAYALQHEPQPSESQVARLSDGNCRMEYRTAYAKTANKRKRSAALRGGLLGTGIVIAVALAAASSSN